MPRFLKTAILCGAMPLLVGTLIYGLWRFTRWHWLEAAGLFTIPLGFAAFIAGAVSLLCHLKRELRVVERAKRGPLWVRALLVGGLLLINFPAAALYTLSAIEVATRYTIHVHNDSDQPVQSLVVTGPDIRVELGPLVPGQQARRHLHFRGDGTLDFSACQQELQFSGQLDGYVTGGLGGEKSIRIRPGGAYEIQRASSL